MVRLLSWMNEGLDEPTLVASARDGDRGAFDRLVRAHFAGVYATLFRLVGNHEDAEDLAQETFVRAYGGLSAYRGDCALRPWLTRIALHLARDHFRRRGRGAQVVQLEGVGGSKPSMALDFAAVNPNLEIGTERRAEEPGVEASGRDLRSDPPRDGHQSLFLEMESRLFVSLAHRAH